MKKFTLTSFLLSIVFCVPGQVNLQLLGHLQFSTSTAGVWHYVDSHNNEYALVGAGNGIAIVDVTNPSLPVQKFLVSANQSLWRELKTFGHYCYATTEGGGGVTIINLEYLPDSVQSKTYTGDGAIAGQLNRAHTCQVSKDGYLYIFGSNIGAGGALICNLNPDPWNPQYTGMYNQAYVHDGFVLYDTLWTAEIYAGRFAVVDVSNKSNPVQLAYQQTPGSFCHNTWLSDDRQYLFTTDEVGGAPVGVFDVSSLSNMPMKAAYFTELMPAEEVHNVRVLNDFLINPSYGSQLTIVDVLRPQNPVEIASYPTGTFLCWDASPYLPSGNIIATDTYGGLYIFQPNYIRACYLEGLVTDTLTHLPLSNVSVKILPSVKQTFTAFTGEYKTGITTAGAFDVEFSKPGYVTKVIPGVVLTSGMLTVVDVQLMPFSINGTVVDAVTLNGIPGAKVKINAGATSLETIADASGNFSISGVNSGTVEITGGLWSYQTNCMNVTVPSVNQVIVPLNRGYYDDFTFDFGWNVSGTATGGMWERGEPIGTGTVVPLNPDSDVVNDCSVECYVTGNAGGSPVNDDVDNGYTQLTSPMFDLSGYSDPYLYFSYWFVDINSNPAFDDTLFVFLENGNVSTTIMEVHNGNTLTSEWISRGFRIADFLVPTSTMMLDVFTEDKPGSGSTLECGFDHFFIHEGPLTVPSSHADSGSEFYAVPNPFHNQVRFFTEGSRVSEIEVYDITGRRVYTAGNISGKSYTADFSFLQPGMYLIRAGEKENKRSLRLIKY